MYIIQTAIHTAMFALNRGQATFVEVLLAEENTSDHRYAYSQRHYAINCTTIFFT